MISAKVSGDGPGMDRFVVARLVESNSEGPHRPTTLYLHQRDHGRRVYSSGQHRSERHVGLHPALYCIFEKRFELLLVYRVDRFARSLKVLVGLLEELDTIGVAFRSATEPIDTSTATGRMLIQLLGVFAEFKPTISEEQRKSSYLFLGNIDPDLQRGVFEEMASYGTSRAALIANTGIELAALDDPAARMTHQQKILLFRNVQRLSANPAVGLLAGQRQRLSDFGVFGYALASSATLGDALAFGGDAHRCWGNPDGCDSGGYLLHIDHRPSVRSGRRAAPG